MSLADALGRFAPPFDFQLLVRVVANLFAKLDSVEFPRQAAEEYLADLQPKLGARDAIEEMLLWQMVLAHFQVLAFSEQAATPEFDVGANAAAARCGGTFVRLLRRLMGYRKMCAKLDTMGARGDIERLAASWNEQGLEGVETRNLQNGATNKDARATPKNSAIEPCSHPCPSVKSVVQTLLTTDFADDTDTRKTNDKNAQTNKDAACASPEIIENAATNKDASRSSARISENAATNKDASQPSARINENAATNKDASQPSARINENAATNKDASQPSARINENAATNKDASQPSARINENAATNKDASQPSARINENAATNKDASRSSARISENAATNKDASRQWRNEQGSSRRRRSYHLSDEGRARLRESARQRQAWLASTGPRSEEGKRSSRLNAVKTGFYSRSCRTRRNAVAANIETLDFG